jgi:hypothetical protein
MDPLRSKVIRLAYQQPTLRPVLLPLLTDKTAGSGYELLIGQRGAPSKVKKFKNKTQAQKWVDKHGDEFDNVSWPSARDEQNMDLS